MAESLLNGKEERDELERKLKMKKEVFDQIAVFVKHSVFYGKMLKFSGKLFLCTCDSQSLIPQLKQLDPFC